MATLIYFQFILGQLTILLEIINNLSRHTTSFKISISKVQDFGNFELSPMHYADVSSKAKGLNFCPSLHLHPYCLLVILYQTRWNSLVKQAAWELFERIF